MTNTASTPRSAPRAAITPPTAAIEVAELQPRSPPAAQHQTRERLGHHGGPGGHGRGGDAAPRRFVAEDVLNDERTDCHGRPKGRRPDDLPAGQDAQDMPLELRTANVVDASTVPISPSTAAAGFVAVVPSARRPTSR